MIRFAMRKWAAMPGWANILITVGALLIILTEFGIISLLHALFAAALFALMCAAFVLLTRYDLLGNPKREYTKLWLRRQAGLGKLPLTTAQHEQFANEIMGELANGNAMWVGPGGAQVHFKQDVIIELEDRIGRRQDEVGWRRMLFAVAYNALWVVFDCRLVSFGPASRGETRSSVASTASTMANTVVEIGASDEEGDLDSRWWGDPNSGGDGAVHAPRTATLGE